MSVVETLRAGRNVIDRLGWRQGPYNFGGGRRCAADALSHPLLISNTVGERSAAYEALERALPTDFSCEDWRRRVPAWNDVPGRQVEDVLALYDKAIAVEEAKEKVHVDPA